MQCIGKYLLESLLSAQGWHRLCSDSHFPEAHKDSRDEVEEKQDNYIYRSDRNIILMGSFGKSLSLAGIWDHEFSFTRFPFFLTRHFVLHFMLFFGGVVIKYYFMN